MLWVGVEERFQDESNHGRRRASTLYRNRGLGFGSKVIYRLRINEIEEESMEHSLYDVVVLGAGPAGLQAAIHASRRKAAVALLGKPDKSSLFHAHVENFCCIFNITGEQMLDVGRQQAVRFGTRWIEEDVMKVELQQPGLVLDTESGQRLRTKSLVIATGSSRNRLGVAGEKELLGKGVSYCVECDANFFRNQTVAVVGNESAAVGGALTLLGYAQKVHLICDRLQVVDSLRESLAGSAVVVHTDSKVEKIEGEQAVTGLALTDGSRLPVDGVFIELGARGVMELATALGIRLDDDARYIDVDRKQQTNVAGVYAAGDVCGPPWQMAKAVGEGCVAGLEAAGYARKLKI